MPYYEVEDDFPPPPPISDDGVARDAWEEPAVLEFRFHESSDLGTVNSLITKYNNNLSYRVKSGKFKGLCTKITKFDIFFKLPSFSCGSLS